MFETLLKAKQDFVSKNNTDQQFETFLKTFQEFEKQMEAIEVKPSQDKLYGRPYRV